MSSRTLLKIGITAVVVVMLAMILTSRKADLNKGKKGTPQANRLIESLQGSDLFQAYCASCHGQDGKGGGPTAAALKGTVPDLTRIRQRSGGSFPASRVQRIISGEEGIAAHGSREMPVWGPIFKRIAWDQDLGRLCTDNLTEYLETIQQP